MVDAVVENLDGETTLLERTIRKTGTDLSISMIDGDQATRLDTERIKATGCRVVQVSTGAGCHLDADIRPVSATKGDGMHAWYCWHRTQRTGRIL